MRSSSAVIDGTRGPVKRTSRSSDSIFVETLCKSIDVPRRWGASRSSMMGCSYFVSFPVEPPPCVGVALDLRNISISSRSRWRVGHHADRALRETPCSPDEGSLDSVLVGVRAEDGVPVQLTSVRVLVHLNHRVDHHRCSLETRNMVRCAQHR